MVTRNPKYPTLTTLANLLIAGGWMLVVAGAITFASGFVPTQVPAPFGMPGSSTLLATRNLMAFGGGIMAVVAGLLIAAYGEGVGVLFAIEAHTRRAVSPGRPGEGGSPAIRLAGASTLAEVPGRHQSSPTGDASAAAAIAASQTDPQVHKGPSVRRVALRALAGCVLVFLGYMTYDWFTTKQAWRRMQAEKRAQEEQATMAEKTLGQTFVEFPRAFREAAPDADWQRFENGYFIWSQNKGRAAFRRCSGGKPTCLLMVYEPGKSALPRFFALNIALNDPWFPNVNFFPLVFDADRLFFAQPHEVYVYDLRSNTHATLATDAWFAAVSPDRTAVAYLTSFASGGANLWVVSSDGTKKKRLTDFTVPNSVPESVAWSADGHRICFAIGMMDKGGTWAVHPDGTHLEKIDGGSFYTWGDHRFCQPSRRS